MCMKYIILYVYNTYDLVIILNSLILFRLCTRKTHPHGSERAHNIHVTRHIGCIHIHIIIICLCSIQSDSRQAC